MNDQGAIIITGGAGGLGQAIAAQIGSSEQTIVLIDIDQHALAATEKTLQASGKKVASYAIDITNESLVDETFDDIAKQYGGIAALINNAGIIRDSLLLKVKDGQVSQRMALSDWQQVININLTAVFLCGRAAATQMATQEGAGCIINISSIAAAGNRGQTNYSATKAGVEAMTVTWAKELAKYDIRCAAIAPGFVATPMLTAMRPEVLQTITDQVPLKRLAEPSEIAATVQFILDNEYISGRTFAIDGGLRL